MPSLSHVKSVLERHLADISTRYPIESMAVFGSVARGEETEKSDVDILVEFNGKIGLDFIDLAEELENILGCHVDLVSKGGVKERYMKAIEPHLIYI